MSVVLVVLLAACGKSDSSVKSSKEESENKGDEAWLEKAELDKTETPEELYEKAKKEGKVTVYSQSSRIKDVKASFEAKYPGIKVEAYDMDTAEMVEKIVREQDSGLFNVDIAFIKDAGGVVSNELVKDGRLHKYLPNDIKEKLADPYKNEPGLGFYFSTRAIFYNTEKYDKSPINNWWDLTDPKWKSKVVMDDPMISSDTLDLLVTIVQNADDMEKAYEEKYGKPLKLDGTENAGYEFLKRLLANDPIFVKSSDEVVTAVGSAGQQNPPVGIAASSKARNIKDEGLKMDFVYDVSPKMSVPGTSYMYIPEKAKNVNAAKLLIRWMAGEADGKAEGFRPYNVLGSWSTRTDIVLPEQRPSKELNLWPYDGEFLYKNTPAVKDFILVNQ